MSAFADPQTLSDLNIPGRHRNKSIARLFDTVVTAGGRRLMDAMFQKPLSDPEEINRRSRIFSYFAKQAVSLPFTDDEFDIVENYLSGGGGNLLTVGASAARKRMALIMIRSDDYAHLQRAVHTSCELLSRLKTFIDQLPHRGGPWSDEIERARTALEHAALASLRRHDSSADLPLLQLIRSDHLLRTKLRDAMAQLIAFVYQLDVFIAVSRVGRENGFTYARALARSRNTLSVTHLCHPALDNAVGNSISLNGEVNAVFLTGANMAGKSTLMKAFGIAIYLAHMGFPVAASDMEFSVKDGLFTSINVPDNLALGYSHFYAEVLRVKAVAEGVAAGKELVVVFDELFKGTNVKDAYDATLSLTEALAENRDSFFVVSTHIVEVGEALRERCRNFLFIYLPTVMRGVIPHYTYRLVPGITRDKQGMTIIENEGILELIGQGR